MANNNTMSSVMSYAVNRTADSTIPDQETLVTNIVQATYWINVTQARLMILKENMAKDRQSKKRNQTHLGDCTQVSQTFYGQVLELWTKVQNHKIKIHNETNLFFNALAPGIMDQSSANPEIEMFRRKILSLGEKLTPLLIVLMEMTQEKEQLDVRMMKNQREMVALLGEVGDHMEQAESDTHPREIQRSNERLMKVKICRNIINTLLARSAIDYQEYPDLVDLKIKWRNPISVKPESL